MAFVVAGIGAGLSAVPMVGANSNCQSDFNIPDSEPANGRSLSAGLSEVGVEDVKKNNPETLHVELVSADLGDELSWTVYFLDSQDECSTYTAGDCDIGGTYPNLISLEGVEQTCTLDAPEDRNYWVMFEATGLTSIEYNAWVS